MRRFVQYFLYAFAVLLIIGACLATVQVMAHADNTTRVLLSNQTAPLIQKAHFIQAANPTQSMHLSIGMRWRNQTNLSRLLSDMYNPHSPSFHRFLTPAQFHQLFSPTSVQVQSVVSFLQQAGFHIDSIAPNNLLINATGSVDQVQRAFVTQINTYQLGNRTFRANATAPSVPSSLSSSIDSVNGLDESFQFQPLFANTTTLHQHNQTPGTFAAPSGYAPSDLAAAYDLQPLLNASLLGDNQTIALFELDGYLLTDILQYFLNFNLGSPHISNVLVDGFNGLPGTNSVEDELDIQVAGGLAPHANLLVYEGPNTIQGINDTFNQIVNDNNAPIVSISWGYCESVTGSAEMQTLDAIFAQGAAQGISFFAASGDAGAYDCQDTNLAVDYPASDPYVTGVGGTTLQMNNGAYGNEVVWSDPNVRRGPNGSGSGGGLSMTFQQPNWQTGAGVQNQYSNGNREVPDVSADAASVPGYAIYCTVSTWCPIPGWLTVGGTSGAAPLWAAGTTLVNQYLQTQGLTPIGTMNPTLYNLANSQQSSAPFHDITTGNNLHYPATPGYDLATGLGSPDFNNIALDLAANASPPPGTTIARDTFQRANQTFWGTASDGNAWSGDANTQSAFSIANNAGKVTGNSAFDAIIGNTEANAEVEFSGFLSSFSNSNMGAELRWNDTNNWYRAFIDGSNLNLQKRVNGNNTTLDSTPFSVKAGKVFYVRVRIVGSTLYARAWLPGQTEPSNWMVTATDSTFQSGYCGLRIRLSNTTAKVTSFVATAQ